MSRNVYVSNTSHTMQPNVRNIRSVLHPVFEMRFRLLRVICRRSFIGVGARDDEHESESDEHMSLRFRLTPPTSTVPPPVSASSSFRLRIFLPPTTTADDLLLTSLLICARPGVHADDRMTTTPLYHPAARFGFVRASSIPRNPTGVSRVIRTSTRGHLAAIAQRPAVDYTVLGTTIQGGRTSEQ